MMLKSRSFTFQEFMKFYNVLESNDFYLIPTMTDIFDFQKSGQLLFDNE